MQRKTREKSSPALRINSTTQRITCLEVCSTMSSHRSVSLRLTRIYTKAWQIASLELLDLSKVRCHL